MKTYRFVIGVLMSEGKAIYLCMLGPWREERPMIAFHSKEEAMVWFERRGMVQDKKYEGEWKEPNGYLEGFIEEVELV